MENGPRSPAGTHLYTEPPIIVGCEGCYLIDQAGRRYFDCTSGGGRMNAGYRNPMILNTVVDQLWRLQHCGPNCLTDQVEELSATLGELTGGSLSPCMYLESEWEARQMAAQLAAAASGRQPSAVHLTGTPAAPQTPEELERALALPSEEPPAAIIAEPTFLDAGLCLPPQSYWGRIRDLGHQHGALLIFDETRTGMNRTGRWFAYEHWGIVPDLLVIGTAATNGIPFGVILATGEIAEKCGLAEAPSVLPNPVTGAAAMATIRFHRTAALAGRSARFGERLLHELRSVVERSAEPEASPRPASPRYVATSARDGQPEEPGNSLPAGGAAFADPRGLGLLLAVDVVNESGEPDPAGCNRCLEQLKDWGFLLGKSGRHAQTLTILPPLTITDEQLPLIAAALAELVHAESRKP